MKPIGTLTKSGQWLTVGQAEEVLTPLSELGLTVRPGERVVVVGSQYYHALAVAGMGDWWQAQIPCVPHPNGFWMGALSQPEFLDRLIAEAKKKADAIYDAELRAGHTTPTELAEAAFQVWCGSYSEAPEVFVIRRVAHALWAGEEGLVERFLATGRIIWKLDPVECRKIAEDRLKPFLEVV